MNLSGGGANSFMNIGGGMVNVAAMGGGNAAAINAGNNLGGVGHNISMIDNRPPPPPHTSLLHMAGKLPHFDFLPFLVCLQFVFETNWLHFMSETN